MKRVLVSLLFCLSTASFAQVGINTTTPNAQLEIKSSNEALPANTDGLLIPKVTTFPASNPTAAQQGMMVYLTTLSGTNLPGFYYWNNPTSAWIPVKGVDGGTLDQAYDFGGSGAGNTIIADTGAVTIAGNDGLISTGTIGSGALPPSGGGVRMVWNPRKAAFRAGIISGNSWDDTNTGSGSVAFSNSTASGTNSFAGGGGTATGQSSFAYGTGAIVSGASQDAIAIGIGSQSTAFRAVSIGAGNVASAGSSVSIGNSNTSSGSQAITIGNLNNAVGSNSMALVRQNTSFSYGETVLGIGATNYTPSINGATEFRAGNTTDRLFVVGNAIDTNNNSTVDVSERSDALVILKNGNTGIGSSTPQDRLHILGNIRMVDGNQAAGRVLTSDASGRATWQNASNNAWGLTGNTGTNAATNFVGTTDNIDLVFRRFNVPSGRISDSNTFFGRLSGSVSTATNNTYLGTEAGRDNITGQQNVFLGRRAGALGSSGSDNILIGNGAGILNESNQNTFVGSFSGNGNTTAANNSFLGFFSGANNGTGGQNTFLGAFAGTVNATGIQNTLVGCSANLLTNNLTNATAIGANSFVSASNSLVLGSIGGFNSAVSDVNVGIGTPAPLDRLHVVGNMRMVDGNQAAGRVLTSDANGTATWQNASANAWGVTGNAGTTATTNFMGTTDNVDLVLKTNNTDNFRIKNDGRIEIGNNNINPVYLGATSLTKKLFIATETATNNLVFQASNAASDPVSMYFGASRGNIATPTIVGANQNISNLFFSGYDGTQFVNSAAINARLDGTPGLNSMPGMLQFQTTQSGSSAVTTRMVIRSSGNVGIGVTVPSERLHVGGRSIFTNGFSADNAALLYQNNTDYMFLGPQSGSSANGAAMALYGSTNVAGGNAGGIDLNVPGSLVRMNHTNGNFIFGANSTSGYNANFELNDVSLEIGHNSATRAISFHPSSTERMRLTPAGNLGIGTNNPLQKLHVSGPAGLTAVRIANTSGVGANSNVALDFFRNTAVNTDWRIYNIGANLTIGNSADDLATVNDLYQFQGGRFMPMDDATLNLGQAANRWNTLFASNGTINTSDAREKKNIQNLNYGLDELLQLRPVSFEWKKDDGSGTKLGLIAQELQQIVPEVVRDWDWQEDEQGNRTKVATPILGVYYSDLIPVLIKSIQEQQHIIKEQNNELVKLKAQLENQNNLILQRLEALENKK